MAEPKWTRFVYLPDPHGDHVNEWAWSVAMQFIKDYAPHRVVIGGDFSACAPCAEVPVMMSCIPGCGLISRLGCVSLRNPARRM